MKNLPMKIQKVLRFIMPVLVVAGASAVALPAWSAVEEPITLVVTTTRDADNPTDGRCSLREAITSVQSNAVSGPASGECPAGTVSIPDAIRLKADKTYLLTLDGVTDDDDNVDGDLDFSQGHSTIVGGNGTTIVQTENNQRVIDVLGGTLTIERVVVTGGHPQTPGSVDGGGIRNDGTLTLKRVKVVGNTAGTGDFGDDTTGGNGGGVYNTGTVTVESSRISKNAAGAGGSTTSLTEMGTAGGWGGGIFSFGDLTVTDSKILSNRAGKGGNSGGGFVFGAPGTGGHGGPGGGIATTMGALSITRTTIAANRAGSGGAGGDGGDGESAFPAGGDGAVGGEGGFGGGISRQSAEAMTIVESTISGNWAGKGGAGGKGGEGTPVGADGEQGSAGAGGGLRITASAELRNVTVSGNRARSGGGIHANANVLAKNITVARNVASGNGGGIFVSSGSFALHNSILADNKADAFVECSGVVVGNSNNLVEDADGCGGLSGTDISFLDPRLGPLDSNGGPTKTHALLRNSPAINEGNPGPATGTVPACEETDQRGRARSICDIGAYEKY